VMEWIRMLCAVNKEYADIQIDETPETKVKLEGLWKALVDEAPVLAVSPSVVRMGKIATDDIAKVPADAEQAQAFAASSSASAAAGANIAAAAASAAVGALPRHVGDGCRERRALLRGRKRHGCRRVGGRQKTVASGAVEGKKGLSKSKPPALPPRPRFAPSNRLWQVRWAPSGLGSWDGVQWFVSMRQGEGVGGVWGWGRGGKERGPR
jgi:hypothetical protein